MGFLAVLQVEEFLVALCRALLLMLLGYSRNIHMDNGVDIRGHRWYLIPFPIHLTCSLTQMIPTRTPETHDNEQESHEKYLYNYGILTALYSPQLQ